MNFSPFLTRSPQTQTLSKIADLSESKLSTAELTTQQLGSNYFSVNREILKFGLSNESKTTWRGTTDLHEIIRADGFRKTWIHFRHAAPTFFSKPTSKI